MNKQTENTKRAPYEAPRLTVVRLQPEEQLLTCDKRFGEFACDYLGIPFSS